MSAMPEAKNQPDDIKIRKYRDTLVTGGLAIIAFGVWTVLKGILELPKLLRSMLGNMTFEEFAQAEAEELKAMIADDSLFYLMMFTIVAMLVVGLAIRIFVGLSARSVGLQKRKRNGKVKNGIVWLIFGILVVAIDGYFAVSDLLAAGEILKEHSITYFVISLFVDMTSLFVSAELIITGFKLRALNKKHIET